MSKTNVCRIVSSFIALTVMFFCLVSCATHLSGTYSTSGLLKQSFTFKSDDVVVISAFGIDAEGTYKIENGKITITYKLMNIGYDFVKDFEKKGDSIFIDGTEFKKQ